MSIAYAKFFPPTVLGVAVSLLYTVPAQPTSNLFRGGRIRFTNTSASAAAIDAYAVPAAGGPTVANAFLKNITVPAYSYIDSDVPILSAGDTLQALCGTATSITAHAVFGGVFSS